MFGKILKDLRTRNNLSQKDLAKALYLSNSSISHYENNRCMPSRETVEAVAHYFNVSTDYLLDSSRVYDLEAMMHEEYHNDISINELLMMCLNISENDRSTLLTIIRALQKK